MDLEERLRALADESRWNEATLRPRPGAVAERRRRRAQRTGWVVRCAVAAVAVAVLFGFVFAGFYVAKPVAPAGPTTSTQAVTDCPIVPVRELPKPSLMGVAGLTKQLVPSDPSTGLLCEYDAGGDLLRYARLSDAPTLAVIRSEYNGAMDRFGDQARCVAEKTGTIQGYFVGDPSSTVSLALATCSSGSLGAPVITATNGSVTSRVTGRLVTELKGFLADGTKVASPPLTIPPRKPGEYGRIVLRAGSGLDTDTVTVPASKQESGYEFACYSAQGRKVGAAIYSEPGHRFLESLDAARCGGQPEIMELWHAPKQAKHISISFTGAIGSDVWAYAIVGPMSSLP